MTSRHNGNMFHGFYIGDIQLTDRMSLPSDELRRLSDLADIESECKLFLELLEDYYGTEVHAALRTISDDLDISTQKVYKLITILKNNGFVLYEDHIYYIV